MWWLLFHNLSMYRSASERCMRRVWYVHKSERVCKLLAVYEVFGKKKSLLSVMDLLIRRRIQSLISGNNRAAEFLFLFFPRENNSGSITNHTTHVYVMIELIYRTELYIWSATCITR